jgi:hypothetical protein
MKSWRDIDGRLTIKEGETLQRYAKERVVFEIGSLFGRSTICMAEVATCVHAIDPHRKGNTDWDKNFKGRNSLLELQKNIQDRGYEDKVFIHVCTVNDMLRSCECFTSFGFIDGCHDYSHVSNDLAFMNSIIRVNGTVACHDYDKRHKGVIRAVDNFIGFFKYWKVIDQQDTIIVLKKEEASNEQ